MIEIKAQVSRYMSAFLLPSGEILRHSKACSQGGSSIHRWGVVPVGKKEECGWGEARYLATINPCDKREINKADLDLIIRDSKSFNNPLAPDPPANSALWWYMDHIPYWGYINDGNRDIEKHGPRLEIANRAFDFYKQGL